MRKDKKTMIKASLPLMLLDVCTKEAERIGFAGASPYLAELVLGALQSEAVTRGLTPYFRRGYVPRWDKSRVFMGHVIAPKLEPLMPEGGEVRRFPVKFLQEDYLAVGEVAYALGCSLAQACTILISEALIQGVTVSPRHHEEAI